MGYTLEITATRSFGCVSATAMTARRPAPPPPTTSTSQAKRSMGQMDTTPPAPLPSRFDGLPAREARAEQVAVQSRDEGEANLLGAHGFALARVRAAPEHLPVHRGHHVTRACGALGLPLRQEPEVRHLRGCEQHGGGVRARGDAGAAADARRRVEGEVRVFFADQDGVGVGRRARRRADEAARLDDSVKGAPVDDQILDDRERSGAPGLERQAIAVPEAPHVELADGGGALGSVRDAVDHEATRAADTLAAVVLERDRRLAAVDQLLVDDVEHLEKGHVRADALRLVGDEAAAGVRALLAPYPERQVHL